ncbi:zinc finger CCCH domain-containing protein 15-like [Centruroides sculpturatus]|uniref:zinc finger CCCH domain-containing protein 15-like n=1 Tax=Centruroides sculpturatus TaxID=218467 RepID=UPI000C6E601B|nr:zinc finger CCCH domain-containing protein 15-like [Centruroides sculpturatus]
MPPKKSKSEPSKKTEQKKKEKVIEDKTFGLKNKKGAKQQKYIQQVQHQVKFGNQSVKKVEQQKTDKNKDEKKKEIEQLNQLFRPVTVQKIEKGADPKSVLCAFYKQGHCTKGDKCKFSHDLSTERKSEKRNVYVDLREADDNMENWDEEKLKEVVEKKHGEAERKMPKTDIICKYFLDALENSKYGWFWECPNGGIKCHYRHALPPGFVLKKDKKKEEKKEDISIEDLVETERAKLPVNLTKITLQTFLAWKNQKLKEKEEITQREEERKKAEFKAGRHIGLSGRDMFTFRPELADEDEMEEGETTCDFRREYDDDENEEGENAVNYVDLTIESLSSNAREVDGTGTVALMRHWEEKQATNSDRNEESEAAGGDCAVPIDEHLFEDDDLQELEEDLQELKC